MLYVRSTLAAFAAGARKIVEDFFLGIGELLKLSDQLITHLANIIIRVARDQNAMLVLVYLVLFIIVAITQ
jgi:hypothetical protein